MSIKTIVVVVVAVLLTIVLMQNTDEVYFKFLFSTFRVSKLMMMLVVAVTGFILGLIIAWPKKQKFDIGGYHDAIHDKNNPDTLSNEDREYIN